MKPTENKMSGLALTVLALYFSSFVFEGAIRYAFAQAGLASLLYARDLIPLMAIVFIFFMWAEDRVRPSAFLIFLFILTFHLTTGTFYLGGLVQQLFGFKIFLPMILGMAIASYIRPSSNYHQYLPYLIGVFLISFIGLAVNYYLVFPWEGESFESVFAVTEQSRNWTAGGVRRLAGLSRASFDAASILLVSAILLWIYFLHSKLRFIIFVLAAVGIALTTTKGALLALFAFGVAAQLSASGKRVAWLKFFLISVTTIIVLIPITSQLVAVSQRTLPENLVWWISSFVERMEWMWPRAFSLWLDKGNWFVGRGIGGIGVPQQYGEWWLANAADNIFVFVTVTFGFLGWIYFSTVIIKSINWKGQTHEENLTVFGLLIGIITFGFTANIIEQPILSCILGYCIVRLFQPEYQRTQ